MRPLLVINIVSQPPAGSSVPPQIGHCHCTLGISIETLGWRWVPGVCCAVQSVPHRGAGPLVFSDLQDVQDSHEEAARVAPQALKLCSMVCLLSAVSSYGRCCSRKLNWTSPGGGLLAMTIRKCSIMSMVSRMQVWQNCLCSQLRGCAAGCLWKIQSTQTYT